MDSRTQLASEAFDEYDEGDCLMAADILTSKIRQDPNNHELYYERSICHHKLGNYQASLDDANSAIRLNPSDFNLHYQKGLACNGLMMSHDALVSFKKAIELRAKQETSKLSDIFALIRDASVEMKFVRTGASGHQQTRAEDSVTSGASASNRPRETRFRTNGEPVDSTTDRLNKNMNSTESREQKFNNESLNNKNNNDLVSKNGNSKSTNGQPILEQMVLNDGSTINKVSSSATNCNNMKNDNSIVVGTTNGQLASQVNANGHAVNISNIHRSNEHQLDALNRNSQFDWNIRRSERIFLHTSNDPGTSSPQMMTDPHNRFSMDLQSRSKTNSNPSSISSGKGQNKRVHESSSVAYQSNVRANSKSRDETTNSYMGSEIDLDETLNEPRSANITNHNITNGQDKRVMVAPSSSMPATSLTPNSNASAKKDDSYSSKYKRLRRDRERARRGTSKLCTIKPNDLDELHKPPSGPGGSGKRTMRVIAPIDGWLYSGQLSVDENSKDTGNGLSHYVVKLDGDTSSSSYLFTQETVLNDVIKEVRVKSVSDLRKGARICCYWSRTYKCLSTGVVTSRTFEATKSLVSVKYDNGDLSALPLEDLRLLPPDYPKYMSNCDPLLLSRNSDGMAFPSECNNQTSSAREVVAQNESMSIRAQTLASNNTPMVPGDDPVQSEVVPPKDETPELSDGKLQIDESFQVSFQPIDLDETDDDEVIPTNEAIDLITSEALDDDLDQEHDDDDNHTDIIRNNDKRDIKDSITLTNDSQSAVAGASRASSEENNFGNEYRPWMFEGKPRSTKRNGRHYRDIYTAIRRGNEVLKIGDSAELMPRDVSILPFIAKIDGIWCTGRGEMRVRVRWYYRLVETEGEPESLKDGDNALFETDHFDENDVQSIWRSTKILSWTDYSKSHLGHDNKQNDGPRIFYLAGYYDPVRRIKHLRSDVKEAQ